MNKSHLNTRPNAHGKTGDTENDLRVPRMRRYLTIAKRAMRTDRTL